MTKPAKSTSRRRQQANPLAALTLLSRRSQAQLEEDHVRNILLAYHAALIGMRAGCGNEELWNTLAYSMNVALILSELGVQPHALQIIQDAQIALVRIRDVARQSGEWKLGPHAFIINCACKQHDEQLASATINQLREARAEVQRRMNSGNNF